jgi:hypothetical protein
LPDRFSTHGMDVFSLNEANCVSTLIIDVLHATPLLENM